MALPTIDGEGRKWVASVRMSIIALACYQAGLCFVNTNVIHLTNAAVAVTEASVLLIVSISIAGAMSVTYYSYMTYIVVYFAGLWIIRGGIAPEELRNILIIYIFYNVGRNVCDRRLVDRLLSTLSIIILVFCVLEYFFSDFYLKYFDIFSYFASRGVIDDRVPTYLTQNLYLSGMRPEGRTIFPFLGDQRVSSIFLEPVSLGNYAVVVALWGLSYDLAEWRKALKHIVSAIIFVVACDSRFASIIILFVTLGRFMPMAQSRASVFAMPILAVLSLMLYAVYGAGHAYEDNLAGRVMLSALAITNMKLDNVLGIGNPETLADMGIAYSIENFGVFLCLLLWAFFSFMKIENRYGKRLRVMIAIYCLGLLTVSGTSFFSAKTAAMLWFMFGASREYALSARKSIERKRWGEIYAVAHDDQRRESHT